MYACMCEFVQERASERESIRVWLFSEGVAVWWVQGFLALLFRESSRRNYYLISPRVLIKAIFIIGVHTSLFRIIWPLFRIDRALFGVGMALFRIDRALLSVYIDVCVYVLTGQRVWRPHSSCVRVCVYVCSCVLREREYVWMYV